jgi:hypothetical protein
VEARCLAERDVHRYGIPRTDLKVTLDGVEIKPALALGGWVALERSPDGTMMMDDLVLTETEVTPVMTKLCIAALRSRPCTTTWTSDVPKK